MKLDSDTSDGEEIQLNQNMDWELSVLFSLGYKDGNISKINRGKDSMVLIEKKLDDFYYIGIFDSNGSSGREISDSL